METAENPGHPVGNKGVGLDPCRCLGHWIEKCQTLQVALAQNVEDRAMTEPIASP